MIHLVMAFYTDIFIMVGVDLDIPSLMEPALLIIIPVLIGAF